MFLCAKRNMAAGEEIFVQVRPLHCAFSLFCVCVLRAAWRVALALAACPALLRSDIVHYQPPSRSRLTCACLLWVFVDSQYGHEYWQMEKEAYHKPNMGDKIVTLELDTCH
jgi:hypothetical protein